MSKKGKKKIAPIIIATITALYFIFLAVNLIDANDMPLYAKIVCVAAPIGFVGVCFFVLFERIKEIESGEEDDLSKY